VILVFQAPRMMGFIGSESCPGLPTIYRVEIDFANLQEGGVFALDSRYTHSCPVWGGVHLFRLK